MLRDRRRARDRRHTDRDEREPRDFRHEVNVTCCEKQSIEDCGLVFAPRAYPARESAVPLDTDFPRTPWANLPTTISPARKLTPKASRAKKRTMRSSKKST